MVKAIRFAGRPAPKMVAPVIHPAQSVINRRAQEKPAGKALMAMFNRCMRGTRLAYKHAARLTGNRNRLLESPL